MVAHLLAFASYMGLAAVATLIYAAIYTRLTPHNEIELIRDGNVAAGVAFGGSLLGFALALAGLIENSVSLLDFGVWSIVALAVQVIVYFVVRQIYPAISARISDGNLAAAAFLAACSVSAGVLNAACMTY